MMAVMGDNQEADDGGLDQESVPRHDDYLQQEQPK